MKTSTLWAACFLAVVGCAKQEMQSPLESFSARLKSGASSNTSPVSVSADFERNSGIDYARFRLTNISQQQVTIMSDDLPWSQYCSLLRLVGITTDTKYQILGVPPEGLTAHDLKITPISVAPGETLEGRITISECFAWDKKNSPAPKDGDLIVLWSYLFREYKKGKGAQLVLPHHTGAFLIPKV